MVDVIEFVGVTLHWDDFCWSGEIKPPFFESPYGVTLYINTQDEKRAQPAKAQQETWQAINKEADHIAKTVLASVFDYYTQMRPRYAKAGPEWVEHMPELSAPSDLVGRFELTGITLTWPYESKPVRAGLSFRCAWDQEHGLGVVLEQSLVVDIGGADCAVI